MSYQQEQGQNWQEGLQNAYFEESDSEPNDHQEQNQYEEMINEQEQTFGQHPNPQFANRPSTPPPLTYTEEDSIKQQELDIDEIIGFDDPPTHRPLPAHQSVHQDQLLSRLEEIQTLIDKANGVAPTQKINRKMLYPKGNVLESCIAKVKEALPGQDIESAVEMLHHLMHKHCKRAQTKQTSTMKEDTPLNKFSEEGNNWEYNRPIRIVGEYKSKQESEVAHSFVTYGYGAKVLRQNIRDPSLTIHKYNNIITNVIKNTYRAIENAMRQLGREVITVDSQDERLLRAPLINCDKWLDQDQLNTFYRFVKVAYNLEKCQLMPIPATKLYQKILKQLKQRQFQEGILKDPKQSSRNGSQHKRLIKKSSKH